MPRSPGYWTNISKQSGQPVRGSIYGEQIERDRKQGISIKQKLQSVSIRIVHEPSIRPSTTSHNHVEHSSWMDGWVDILYCEGMKPPHISRRRSIVVGGKHGTRVIMQMFTKVQLELSSTLRKNSICSCCRLEFFESFRYALSMLCCCGESRIASSCTHIEPPTRRTIKWKWYANYNSEIFKLVHCQRVNSINYSQKFVEFCWRITLAIPWQQWLLTAAV